MIDHLLVRPSFLNGVARTMDVFASFRDYDFNQAVQEDDLQALKKDFEVVGRDLQIAMDQFQCNNAQEQE